MTTRTGSVGPTQWTNFGGNQTFKAPSVAASTEEQVVECVSYALDQEEHIRVPGSGHSYTPIVETTGSLLALEGPTGVIDVDRDEQRAEVWAHTTIHDLGPELWSAGLALRNQGDMDWQTIAGAVSTGTKGSGTEYGTISSEIRGLTLVDGHGSLRTVTEQNADQLLAGKVSLGLLGVLTRVQLQVEPRYGLEENNYSTSWREVFDTADDRLQHYRHYSFCWCPSEYTAAQHHMPGTAGDACFVKQLLTVPEDHPALQTQDGVVGEAGRRTGRSYVVYPDWLEHEPDHIELEYMLPSEHWRDAFLAMRELMTIRRPDQISPVQFRWQKADDAFLSAQDGRDTVSIALLAPQGNDPHEFLRQVHETLLPFNPRPHWGKMHYFDSELLAASFPKFEEFQAVRDSMDPRGIFLNDYLAKLFRTN